MTGFLSGLAVFAFIGCAAGSPLSRRTFGRWTRGVWNALVPRNVFMGCGLWLLLGWFIGAVILTGWFALLMVSPVLAASDVLDWWQARRSR